MDAHLRDYFFRPTGATVPKQRLNTRLITPSSTMGRSIFVADTDAVHSGMVGEEHEQEQPSGLVNEDHEDEVAAHGDQVVSEAVDAIADDVVVEIGSGPRY